MATFTCSACDKQVEVVNPSRGVPDGWVFMKGLPYMLCEACDDGSWRGDISPELRAVFARKGIKLPE